MASVLQGLNVIVAVGSVDGMAGAAACIRHSKNEDIHLVFTQAFQVNTIDVSKWPPNSKVGFIDLGVNNEDQSPNQQLTIDFVNKVYKSSHTILFIADEHGKKKWGDVLERCGHSKRELTIRPKDRSKYSSSCAVLSKALGGVWGVKNSALDPSKGVLTIPLDSTMESGGKLATVSQSKNAEKPNIFDTPGGVSETQGISPEIPYEDVSGFLPQFPEKNAPVVETPPEATSSEFLTPQALGNSVDAHTQALLHAGDQADRMNFNTQFGIIFNNCTKSNMSDSSRRPYVVRYMAQHATPDAKIQGWMDEYREIQVNLPKILASGKNLGDGIFLYDCTIGRHDATAIFGEAYKTSPVVVLSSTNVFLEGSAQVGTSIATNKKDLNVLEIIQKAGIRAGGMTAKANFALKDQEASIEAVRKAMNA